MVFSARFLTGSFLNCVACMLRNVGHAISAKANQNVSFHHDQFAIKRSYFFDYNR